MIAALLTAFGRLLLRLRYRVMITGLNRVTERGVRGILFLPNHPALIDPVIVTTHLYPLFKARALSEEDQIDRPAVRWIARRLRILPLPDLAKHGAERRAEVEQAILTCAECLRRGDNLIIYPAGRIYRQRYENLGGASAVETILREAPDVRIVLVRTRGLWGSSFGRASGRAPEFFSALLHGLKCLLKSGFFFAPRRRVSVELIEPLDLPRTAPRAQLNRYLEEFYNQDAPPNTYVPYTPWERGGKRVVPEPAVRKIEGDLAAVPETTRRLVRERLAQLTGRKADAIGDDAQLARDLGLDSLAMVDLAVWISQEFGFKVDDATVLLTVGDLMLAACGTVLQTGVAELKPIPRTWFNPPTALEPTLPEGRTITEVFLAQAARNPDGLIVADQAGGAKSYRDIITGIFAMLPEFRKVRGEYAGIMLPASGTAALMVLTALFAGKIPVLLNWTAGSRTMAHALDLLGITAVFTSRRLVQQIRAQVEGGLGPLEGRLVYLEDVGARLGLARKLSAKIRARIGWSSLRRVSPPTRAVILFTSGSENLPKAVPLTHANLLTNMRDILKIVSFRADDRLIGILPPFHSFGLTATLLLPLCGGVRVVYHPKPTEGGMLARLVAAYKVSILVGTPTFLNGIVRAAADDQLASLRLVVAGAEKCPPQLYETVARRWPGMKLLEGYGITECSPAVALNDDHAPRTGTIGKILSSLEYAVTDPTLKARVAPGQDGLLLVRGPSIFEGYLNYEGPSPFVEFEGKSWYRTGDLVRAGADGVLTFAGRLKRFVKLGGEMISLPAIEEILNRNYLPDDADKPVLAVTGAGQELNPELVLFTTLDLDREAVNLRIREGGLSPLHNIRRIVKIDHIPLLGTGKTDYRALNLK